MASFLFLFLAVKFDYLYGVDNLNSAQGERNDPITQCDSVFMVRHPRGSYIV